MNYTIPYSQPELAHHGILDMHWHQRRFQNEDGTLTEAGKKRLAEKRGRKDYMRDLSAENRQKAIDSIIRTGNIDAAFKYKDYMTDAQLTAVIARQELNARLQGKTSKEVRRVAEEKARSEKQKAEAQRKQEKKQKLLDAPANAEKAVKAYNVAAAVANGILGERTFPVIDLKMSEKKEDKKDDKSDDKSEGKSDLEKKLEKRIAELEREKVVPVGGKTKEKPASTSEGKTPEAKTKASSDTSSYSKESSTGYRTIGGATVREPSTTLSSAPSKKAGTYDDAWTMDKTAEYLKKEPALAEKIFAMADAKGLSKYETAVFAKVTSGTLDDNPIDDPYEAIYAPYY